MPRPKRRAPSAGPYAELLAIEAEAAAAAASGDAQAVSLLKQVRSHLAMAGRAGGDAEITGLFAIFAAEDKARLAGWWANPDGPSQASS